MNLSQFFQEANGGFSSTRLAFLVWTIGILVIWAKISWSTSAIAPIDDTVLTLLGILMSGKVVQKFGEKPNNTQEPAV